MIDFIFDNDSLHGQFNDLDEADDYFIEVFFRMMNVIDDGGYKLYKDASTYDCYVTPKEKLADLLRYTGRPVASILRKLIQKPYISNLDDKVMIVSLLNNAAFLSVEEVEENSTKKICCGDECCCCPVFSDVGMLLRLIVRDMPKQLVFAMYRYDFIQGKRVEGTDALDKDLVGILLTADDAEKVLIHINDMIEARNSGKKTHWWDQLDGDIYEYRVTVKSGELRMSHIWGEKIIFLTAFMKKTERTTNYEIRRAKKLRSKVRAC